MYLLNEIYINNMFLRIKSNFMLKINLNFKLNCFLKRKIKRINNILYKLNIVILIKKQNRVFTN